VSKPRENTVNKFRRGRSKELIKMSIKVRRIYEKLRCRVSDTTQDGHKGTKHLDLFEK